MRKLIKKILKENELQWINDVKSNQDIAQEIADETKIKNDLLHTPFPSSSLFLPLLLLVSPSPLFSTFPSFTKYGKEQYGLDNEDDINDVWERYKKLIKYRVNNINESDEWDFVRDVEAKLVVGAHLCFNDKDKFDSVGMSEVTKIDKDNYVFMTDIVTGNRYADHMDDVMSWLESGEVTICHDS